MRNQVVQPLAVDLGIVVEDATADADVNKMLAAADRAMYEAKAAAKRPR